MDGGYDLQVEPWIPVLLLSGQRERLGLRDVFKRAHEIDELEVPVPPAAAGLLRILAAITARIAGDGEEGKSRLDDPDVAEEIEDWLALRERVLRAGRFDPDAVDAYFDRDDLAGRFDLFDPARPFFAGPAAASGMCGRQRIAEHVRGEQAGAGSPYGGQRRSAVWALHGHRACAGTGR
ncbi:type I-E CRISPR-associated protein Cse1/CasA [Streptomyces thermoviolaceus]|uniref:type I-E CRISPR-associated protein Cse1/CasA n=1 Tax=Streptomyces thermoviolaceus TaxID=1952 RepID=UPI0038651E58|nr:type I-E CRISPR-associated protein Cse1/CasA [Streptomyces thermoviolaceus]